MTEASKERERARLIVREATIEDIPKIRQAMIDSYPKGTVPYTGSMLRGHINRFPEGQFVADYDGAIVGYCASFRVSAEVALAPHDWHTVTGQGYAARHDDAGEYLYGLEIFVHPSVRRHRIGQRFYRQRRELCRRLNLAGIVFGGRLPGLRRRIRQVGSAQNYVAKVEAQEIRDPVLTFQLRQGFEVLGVIEGYDPEDRDSLGFAAHLRWPNPHYREAAPGYRATAPASVLPDKIRVAAVQYQQRPVASMDEFFQIVRYFVETVSEYRADFVLFPELFTLQLLTIKDEEVPPAEAIEHISAHTPRIEEEFRNYALRYNINIIAGSHPTMMPNGRVENIAYVYLRDGTVHRQPKIHPTPDEVYWWRIEGGRSLNAIQTDCGPIGVLICYDAEFPELARYLVDQGVNVIFVPFYTDERLGYMRVRHCCQARAVENQCYVVMAGNVGNLPNVANMDIQYAQSCILTPCDFYFSRDGVAADTTPNVEAVALADVSLTALREARATGTVQNLKNRRHDLYRVSWLGD